MRRVLSILLLSVLTVALSACAPSTKKHTYRDIKCPACGYEFSRGQN